MLSFIFSNRYTFSMYDESSVATSFPEPSTVISLDKAFYAATTGTGTAGGSGRVSREYGFSGIAAGGTR